MSQDRRTPLYGRLFALGAERLGALDRGSLGTALALGVVALFVSLQDVQRYAGIDLRNRVVGARVMLAGHNPYAFHWQPGMPLEWLDPVHDPRVHRLTAPPTTLWLYATLAPLPYRAQRILHCLLEWAALIASIALLARLVPEGRLRLLFVLVALVFFVLGDIWRMHVERGQVYVFHLLALTLGAYLLAHERDWTAGLAFGLAAFMRLNLLVLVPAFFLLGKGRTAGMALALVVGGILMTLPFTPAGTWAGYLDVGNQYYTLCWNPESLEIHPPPEHKGPVEGYDFDVHLRDQGPDAPVLTANSLPVLYQRLQAAWSLPAGDLGVVCKALLVFFSLVLFALLYVARKASPPLALGLLLVVALTLDLEYLLPQRWGYVDVVLLLPLALVLPILSSGLERWDGVSELASLGIAVGLLGGLCLGQYLGLFWSTALRSWAIMGSVTLVAVWRWLRTRSVSAA